jgi:hypothetical protein
MSCQNLVETCRVWCSHGGGYKVISSGTQRRVVRWKSADVSEDQALCVACFMLVPCLACSSTVKMKKTSSSQPSVDFHWTIWHYVQDNRISIIFKHPFAFIYTSYIKYAVYNATWNLLFISILPRHVTAALGHHQVLLLKLSHCNILTPNDDGPMRPKHVMVKYE